MDVIAPDADVLPDVEEFEDATYAGGGVWADGRHEDEWAEVNLEEAILQGLEGVYDPAVDEPGTIGDCPTGETELLVLAAEEMLLRDVGRRDTTEARWLQEVAYQFQV
jgi:hypothetical protein